MKITVIVPIFNVEKYLSRCLDSLIAQTYKNLEIILIDDGSSDSSGIIADSYKEKDARFIVVHKENEGVSSSRNKALELSTGTFISFVDGDDYIESNMYELLINSMLEENADIVYCNYKIIYPEKTIVKDVSNIKKLIYENNAILENMDGVMDETMCNKLYRQTVLKDLRFNRDLKIAEDTLFNYFAFRNADKVIYINVPLYNYEKRANSATTASFSIKNFDSRKTKKIILENSPPYLLDKSISGLVIVDFNLLIKIYLTKKCSEEERSLIDEIKKYKKQLFKKLLPLRHKISLILLLIHPKLFKFFVLKFYSYIGKESQTFE